MKLFKKILCIIISSAVIFSICSGYSLAASKATITKLEITSMPVKTLFIKDADWVYGLWNISESTGEVYCVESSKISFTHNAGNGFYPERGMLDMTGLSVKVYYSDGNTKNIDYIETQNSSGIFSANIMASPRSSYSVGTNTVEVYFAENPNVYDSYDIEITETDPYEQLTSETAKISYNTFLVTGLSAGLTRAMLESGIFDFGDAEVTFAKAEKNFKYYGTGSTMTLTHKNGTVEKFTLVVSGDVDGNGTINYDDVAMASSAVADNNILSQAQKSAAEVDGIRRITANDVAMIIKMCNG